MPKAYFSKRLALIPCWVAVALLGAAGCDDDDDSANTHSQSAHHDEDEPAHAHEHDEAPEGFTADQVLTIQTTNGPVRGTVENGIITYKGVRYGADTATTRFAAPAEPEPWQDPVVATAFGDSCPQPDAANPGGLFTSWQPDPVPGTSEDCLFLNVWTPGIRGNQKRPVMVWLHGGGFATGDGSSKAYDGGQLARRGKVVVVTLNHRLNAFGYLALDHYGKGFEDSADAGLLDLVLALTWVRDNAAAIGGDAANVTIFGESGGGAKVTTLLATEAARGLFQRAIVESGAVLSLPELKDAHAEADKVVASLGLTADTIEQIKTKPVAEVLAALKDTTAASAPAIDGRTLTRQTFTPDAPPSAHDVPLLLGTNRTENSLFAGPMNEGLFELDWDGLSEALKHDFPGPDYDVAAIIAGYKKLEPSASASDIYFEATTDSSFLAGHRLQAERKVAQGGAPTWLYLFNWNTPVQGGKWRSPHALEIGFVFDNVASSESMSGVGDEQQKLADIMAETWLAFAKTGDPNNAAIPNWPAYETDARPVMVFDTEPKLVPDARAAQVKLFGKSAGLSYGKRYH